MANRTFTPSKQTSYKWHFVDAKDVSLGRVAVKVSKILMGKDRGVFTPNILTGGKVVVTNIEKMKITGNKMLAKTYIWHTGHPKGMKTLRLEEKMARDPREVFRLAVAGMLPKNKLRAAMLRNLYVYLGEEHPHKAQVK